MKVSLQEAETAKEKMNGRLACGRPLVVRFTMEKQLLNSNKNPIASLGGSKVAIAGSSSGQMSRGVKILAIKNKLKALEEEKCSGKKPRQGDDLL